MSTSETLRLLYNECKDLDMDESLQLILEAETPEEQEFYSVISDFFLQQRQRKVIEANKF